MSDRIAIYARTSTDEQSISRQITECLEHLDRREHSPQRIDEFKDDDETGTSDERTQFIELKEAIARGEYDLVITTEISRLSRTGSESVLRFITNCLEHECGLELVQTPLSFNWSDDELTKALNRVLATLMAELAKVEHAQMMERVYSGISAAQQQGVWTGTPPRGFVQEEGEPLRLDLEEYLHTRRAIERCVLEGESKRSVANETGIPRSTLTRYCTEERFRQLYLYNQPYDERLKHPLEGLSQNL